MSARARTVLTRLILRLVIGLVLSPTIARAQSEEVIYYHTDAIGSVRMITDATGAIVARYDYRPFGEEWPQQPPTQNPDTRQFTGAERDVETQLDHLGVRSYRFSSGRFLTIDPLLDIEEALLNPQLWNRYAYALNNPLRFLDSSGAAIELLGEQADRDKELELLRRVSGNFGARLYINEVKDGNKTRYFIGILGDVGDFTRAGGPAQNLGNLVASEQVVEFGLTDRDLSKWGGAATFESGRTGNANTRVLVNVAQIADLNSSLNPNRTVAGYLKFDRNGVWQPFTKEITAWHEFGHAWGLINGRSMAQTNIEAVRWENEMRAQVYGPLGQSNARRVIH